MNYLSVGSVFLTNYGQLIDRLFGPRVWPRLVINYQLVRKKLYIKRSLEIIIFIINKYVRVVSGWGFGRARFQKTGYYLLFGCSFCHSEFCFLRRHIN
jgi:hypothetical protein